MKLFSRELRAIMTAVFAIMAFTAPAQQYKTVNDIPYSEREDIYSRERCILDVYYPSAQKDCPIVVWLHGGGLVSGDKFVPQELKEQGFAVVAVSYRYMSRVPITDVIDDAAAAVAWTFRNADKYNSTPEKVYVCGHSAGGYLANMVALDKSYLAKYGVDADSVKAYFPLSGQAITHFQQRMLKGISAIDPVIDETAPMAHLRSGVPPIVIISGNRDREMNGRYEEQAYFWRLLQLHGNTNAELHELDGFSHGSMCSPGLMLVREWVTRKNRKK